MKDTDPTNEREQLMRRYFNEAIIFNLVNTFEAAVRTTHFTLEDVEDALAIAKEKAKEREALARRRRIP